MKYLIAVAVTILVILVPFGSWYYLQVGLNYRKASIEALKPKGDIVDISNMPDLFEDHTTLLYNSQLHNLDNEVEIIYGQFETGLTFQLVELNNSDKKSMGNNHIIIPTNAMTEGFDSKNTFAIIDTAGNIRNFYNMDEKSLTEVVEHVAIVIPLPAKKDIKMKNGKDVDAKPGFMKKK